jgi:gamma-glutamyltranspeptidase/glutathione hydrolase
MTGIGGDCYCLVSQPGRPVWGYNGSGRSGSNASAEALTQEGLRAIDGDSIHAVTVPGAVDAWEKILKVHGRFGLDRALAPAIRHAENGFPVAARVAFDWANAVARISRDPGASRHYLSNGRAPREGDVVKLPALATALKAIAAQGARAFYEGPIAEEIAATVSKRGSFLTAEDLARHRGEAVAPITTNYRGIDLFEIPPNGQGLTALVLLNILERFDLAALDPLGADRLHLLLEAARLAYAVRDTHIADAEHMRTPVAALLDKAFAAALATKIDPSRRVALPKAPKPGGDTVYVTVVDRDRMAVSLINSLFSGFGAGIATERTGILLNNRGACFTLAPDHPNVFGPGKRPMHTIIPALAFRGGRCELSYGVMGAHYQPMGHATVLTNMIDYGMDVQTAIDAPRVFIEGEQSALERGIPAATADGLRARGHDILVRQLPYGGSQAIRIDWERGVLIGGSDPRKDGCALGY